MKKPIIFIAALLWCTSATFAQTPWKKTVSRVLDLAPKEDTAKHHLTDVTTDTTLFEIMANAIKAGKLTAYNAFDHDFTTKFTSTQFKEIMGSKTDTQIIVDPTTNKEHQIIVHHEFNYDAIRKYRLLEEWFFDPHTGKTEIQIAGIAPLRDVYGDDGVFRGIQSMFWIKYADAREVLNRYDRNHPTKTFASLIWDDYFLSDIKPQVVK